MALEQTSGYRPLGLEQPRREGRWGGGGGGDQRPCWPQDLLYWWPQALATSEASGKACTRNREVWTVREPPATALLVL